MVTARHRLYRLTKLRFYRLTDSSAAVARHLMDSWLPPLISHHGAAAARSAMAFQFANFQGGGMSMSPNSEAGNLARDVIWSRLQVL